MNIKRYVTLIISKEPINLENLRLEEREDVDHLISEEVEIQSDSKGNMLVAKALPEQTLAKSTNVFRGQGNAHSVAITDWLSDICSSGIYDPLRNRRERESEKRRKENAIIDAFSNAVYDMPDCARMDFEFRLPKVGEKVLVQHGFSRCGVGTVKNVNPDSPDERVVITIHGKTDFDVTYTYEEDSSCWRHVNGGGVIGAGSSIAAYPENENDCNPMTFLMIYPPTEAAKKMADKIYLGRIRESIPSGQASPL